MHRTMKIRPSRIPAYLLLIFTALSPSMLVNQAMAQDSNLFVAAWSNLGPFSFVCRTPCNSKEKRELVVYSAIHLHQDLEPLVKVDLALANNVV